MSTSFTIALVSPVLRAHCAPTGLRDRSICHELKLVLLALEDVWQVEHIINRAVSNPTFRLTRRIEYDSPIV
jgi:hypothetical protein